MGKQRTEHNCLGSQLCFKQDVDWEMALGWGLDVELEASSCARYQVSRSRGMGDRQTGCPRESRVLPSLRSQDGRLLRGHPPWGAGHEAGCVPCWLEALGVEDVSTENISGRTGIHLHWA